MYATDEPLCCGPRPACTDWHFMACINFFLPLLKEFGIPVICYQPGLFKNKFGNKVTRGNEDHLEIWEPTCSLCFFFFFFPGRISKFQPVLMLAHLAALLMKTAASSNAVMWGSTFQKITGTTFGFYVPYFFFCFEKINSNWRAF